MRGRKCRQKQSLRDNMLFVVKMEGKRNEAGKPPLASRSHTGEKDTFQRTTPGSQALLTSAFTPVKSGYDF